MKALALTLCVIAAMATATTAAQAPSVTFQLLSFACVDLDRTEPAELEFEREILPPGTDTGLFFTRAWELLYVEQGRLMISSDEIGETLVTSGFSYLFQPGGALGVRNDGFDEASVLWLRFSQPAPPVPQASARPQGINAWMAPGAIAPPPGLQPLLAQFATEAVSSDDAAAFAPAALFIARMSFAPFANIDPIEQNGRPPTTSGTVAFVVDFGELTVDDGEVRSENLPPGEHRVVDGADRYGIGTGDGPGAVAFAAGIVEAHDNGEAGQAILTSPEQGEPCQAAAS